LNGALRRYAQSLLMCYNSVMVEAAKFQCQTVMRNIKSERVEAAPAPIMIE
jgi:hypothetical protein